MLKTMLRLFGASIAVALFACTVGIADQDKPGLRDGDVVMCFGDSITENGALPWGYIEQMRNLVKEWKPEWNVKFYACGFAGAGALFSSYLLDKYVADKTAPQGNDHITSLFSAIDAKPTIVIYLFGINDVCANNIARSRPADMIRIMDEYFQGVDKIRTIIHPREIWLSPPLCAGERKNTPKNSVVLGYGPLLNKLAPEHGARVLSTRQDFWNVVEAARKLWPDMRLTLDGIHPNAQGHRLIAHAVLKGLGLSCPDGVMPSPLSYLPDAEIKRVVDDGVAVSYDITNVDTAITDDTTVVWKLYLTNVGKVPARMSLQISLPKGFQIIKGSVSKELSLKSGSSREIPLTVRGRINDEKTALVATASWIHEGKSCEYVVKAELHAPWLVLVPVRGTPYLVDQNVPGWKVTINPNDHTPGLELLDLKAGYLDKLTGQTVRWRKYVNHSPYVNVSSQDGIDFYNLDDCLVQSSGFGVRWVHACEDVNAHLIVRRGNWTPYEAYTVWINDVQVYQGILTDEKDQRVDRPIHLRKGWNRVAFKSSMWQFLWHAIIEIRDMHGLPIAGITYSIEPPKRT